MLKFILFLSAIFSIDNISGQSLICTIKSDKMIYKNGKLPVVSVEIKNNTDSSFYLIKTLNNSYSRHRYPYSYFVIEKINDTSFEETRISGCGNDAFIKESDFCLVKPGKTFDPFQNDPSPYFSLSLNIAQKNFSSKGAYKITYYYSTNEADFSKWMGNHMRWKWFNFETNKLHPEYKEEYERFMILFDQVPKMDLVSNTLIIQFK